MWNELQEVLFGLAGAGVALAAVYFFVANAQKHSDGDRISQGVEERPAGEGAADDSAHRPLSVDDRPRAPEDPVQLSENAPPLVARLFICAKAGLPMRQVAEVEAVAGKGLEGDRYFSGNGHWSESDDCEVTMIAKEDLDAIAAVAGLAVQDGQHRRNLVTRNVSLRALMGRRFRIGGACFAYARARPPCLYLQSITEPGMARALVGRGGIGVHCFRSGTIRENDGIVILDISPLKLLRRRWRLLIAGKARPSATRQDHSNPGG